MTVSRTLALPCAGRNRPLVHLDLDAGELHLSSSCAEYDWFRARVSAAWLRAECDEAAVEQLRQVVSRPLVMSAQGCISQQQPSRSGSGLAVYGSLQDVGPETTKLRLDSSLYLDFWVVITLPVGISRKIAAALSDV
jgi:hypothetical protein